MSVMMGLRIAADPVRFEQAVSSNPQRMVEIAERAKQQGAIHHQFYASEAGDEILVVDEWPSAEAFQTFFDSSPDIGELMGEAGVTSPPVPVFWREMDTADKF
jgi:heme-degrading monooxygenase HmoA